MNVYLLSTQGLENHIEQALPLVCENRRQRFLHTHSLETLGAGLLLAKKLGVHADEDLRCGQHGKPFLTKQHQFFSLSHSNNQVLLAVDEAPVGADIERMDRPISQAARNRVCLASERNRDFFTVFTRKECAMKLTGLGFLLPMDAIDTTKDFFWEGETYHFHTTVCRDYAVSFLCIDNQLPPIQLLSAEDFL